MIKEIGLQLLKLKFISAFIDNYAKKEAAISKSFYHRIRRDFVFKIPLQSEHVFFRFDHFISFSDPDVWKKQYIFKSGVPYIMFEGNVVFNPVTVSQYGLACFDYYKKKLPTPKLMLLLNPIYECLLKEHPNYLYNFPLDKYKMTPPWQSALAYSNVLSFYLRMQEYDNSATTPIKDIISILSKDSILKLKYKNEGIWYEEYPSPTPSLVLNGFISVIISLYEYLFVFNDKKIEGILQQSVTCLLEMLEHFDNGIYLKYDLANGHPVEQKYYSPHYYEFKQLYKITSDPNFYYIMGRMKKLKRTMAVFFNLIDALYYSKREEFPHLFNEDYKRKVTEFTRIQ